MAGERRLPRAHAETERRRQRPDRCDIRLCRRVRRVRLLGRALRAEAFHSAPSRRERRVGIPNLRGVTQVPYRLPELVEAISQEHVILIVEGEKDRGSSLVARRAGNLSDAMGARKWKPEHSAWFEGADDVVVVGDNDGAGQDHVQAGRSRPQTAREARSRPRPRDDMARDRAEGRHQRLDRRRRHRR